MGTFHIVKSGIRNLIGDGVDAGIAVGSLDGAVCRLYQNSIIWSKDTLLADLTEADFDGYAEINPITWANTPEGPGNIPYAHGGSHQIVCTGSTSPNEIFGWYLVNAALTDLIAGYKFDQSVFMNEAGDTVYWTVLFMINQITLSLPGLCN